MVAVAKGNDKGRGSLQLYLEEIAASCPLSAQEEVALAARIREGDLHARAKLIEANLRFVVAIAREYGGRGLPLEDLISAGNLGLTAAAGRFDETRGCRFISYGVWWIRQTILKAVGETSRLVRLPTNRLSLLRRISEYTRRQQQKASTNPTFKEISDALGVCEAEVVTPLNSSRGILSLDAPSSDGGKKSLLQMTPDQDLESPEALLMSGCVREEIGAALATLDERERDVVELYYGLGETSGMSLQGIGRRYGVTRERVRQIRDKGLARLRRLRRLSELASLIDAA